ncbi:hypothetical protein K443DRAFT_683415 [Laccaria amethystina LaAM-08-1]|uniref:Uncharacterized protein n=1 Tax=Laccaria amethystina LaAM-08-1 TaxID=1095629 RepID=A0A0C9WST0_9AGAR|nr:hypothetical protein K443DRAFT_683415 [Laccaria amethystina LaAM-08-1]
MALESGTYLITSLAQPPHSASIGRNNSEDKSLNPKRVVALPPGVQRAVWDIEALGDDKYILNARDAPTAAIDGLIFAILRDEPAPTKWFLKLNLHSRTSYNILDSEDPSKGWIFPPLGGGGTDQIKFGEVSGGFSHIELWNITRI